MILRVEKLSQKLEKLYSEGMISETKYNDQMGKLQKYVNNLPKRIKLALSYRSS